MTESGSPPHNPAALQVAAAASLYFGAGGPPLLSVLLLAKARDAWERIAADIALYGLDISSAMVPSGGGINPLPVMVVMARGVQLVDDPGILSWQTLPGWMPDQATVDKFVREMAGAIRSERARLLNGRK